MYIFYLLYILFILYSFYLLSTSKNSENFIIKNKISSKLLNLEKNVNKIKKYIYLQNNLFLRHFKLNKKNNTISTTSENTNKDIITEEENNEE